MCAHLGINLLYAILHTQPPQDEDAVTWFSKAVDLGCPYAAYELWKRDASKACWTPVEELQLIRRLRRLASKNMWPAQLDLCMSYVNHQYGGFAKEQACQFVRQVSVSVIVPHCYDALLIDVQSVKVYLF